MSNKILLSFVGSRDPQSPTNIDGTMEPGPLLKVFQDQCPEVVFLFTDWKNEKFTQLAEQTRTLILGKEPATKVEIIELKITDPQNHLSILSNLRGEFESINRKYEDSDYLINVTSGTPAMHACWFMLAASGEIPAARLFSSKEAKYLRDGERLVREIEFTKDAFPIVRQFSALPNYDHEEDYQAIANKFNLIGNDPAFLEVVQTVVSFAKLDVPVLLRGDPGTGKENFAKMIHYLSPRDKGKYNPINIGAFSSQMVESELFGHVKGAFTGAVNARKGAFAAAEGGTVFLDEIGTLPSELQHKLLRTIQEGVIQRVGADSEIPVDVRIVAATNINLEKECRSGNFRSDLRDRFFGVIELPTLSERKTDISLLANYFLDRWNEKYNDSKKFTGSTIKKLCKYSWPSNVRELDTVLFRAFAMSKGATLIKDSDIQFQGLTAGETFPIVEPEGDFNIFKHCQAYRRRIFERAVELEGGKIVDNKLQGCTKVAVSKRLGIRPQAIAQELNKDNVD